MVPHRKRSDQNQQEIVKKLRKIGCYVIDIHNELVKDYSKEIDPIEPSGVSDKEMLESAVFHNQTRSL